MNQPLETTYFGSGCFWCTEAIFNQVKGVTSVFSGYTGGYLVNPTYEQVSSGKTGHAECLKIEFDPKIISYEQLLEIFFLTHDPTTLNRQGNDAGEQYRSAIFYINEDQKQLSKNKITELENKKVFTSKIVTQILPFTAFFPAENYHQNYFENNPTAPYCQVIINPKLTKFREKFASWLK